EANHQVDVIENGGAIKQETILWDTNLNETRTMRSKEDAHDYRYFPEPDLLPLNLTEERIEACAKSMPELPDEMKERLIKEYDLSPYDAAVLTLSKANAKFYEVVVGGKNDAKLCSNWVTGELFGALNKRGLEMNESPVSPEQLGELVAMISDNTISGKIAKTVFEEMLETSRNPKDIVEEKDLVQITDTDAITAIINKVIEANPDNVAKFKGGNDRLFGFFVGQVMKETGGKANPKIVNEILKNELSA
ncbi:MAG: aspartyl-tRNA(Asn)/glutamyl-tRNA(Gln) amidotransferase subunit B, partial [bacterium]